MARQLLSFALFLACCLLHCGTPVCEDSFLLGVSVEDERRTAGTKRLGLGPVLPSTSATGGWRGVLGAEGLRLRLRGGLESSFSTEVQTPELYMMYHRAKLLGNKKAMQQILVTTYPHEHWAMGRLLRNFEGHMCKENSDGIVLRDNFLKSSENENFKQEFVGTETKRIAEASARDRIWATGTTITHEGATNPKIWKGTNRLDLEVRDWRRMSLRGGIQSEIGGITGKYWCSMSTERRKDFMNFANELDNWMKQYRGSSLKDASHDQILEGLNFVNSSLQILGQSVPKISQGWQENKTDLSVSDLNERLWLACQLGDDDVVVSALSDGAEVDSRDVLGRTALHYAALHNQPSIIQTLITEYNATVDAAAADQYSPLMLAASLGHRMVVDQLLLVGKAKLSLKTPCGKTALHLAAISGWKPACQALCAAGASLTCTDKNGCTPADAAEASGHADVFRFLTDLNFLQMEMQAAEASRRDERLSDMERHIAVSVGWIGADEEVPSPHCSEDTNKRPKGYILGEDETEQLQGIDLSSIFLPSR